MGRVGRRAIVIGLGASLAATIGLFVGALAHRLAEYSGLGHFALEAFLWAGAILACGVFLAAAVGFRREVRAKKVAMRRRRERRELLGLIRRYEADQKRRMNN